MSGSNNKKGFTIIEVVLVLAIAGLIFAAVFIALPALQRGQRNTQRKRDLALIKAEIDNWKSNNRYSKSIDDNFSNRNKTNGFCTFYKRYLGENFVDPDTGEPYKVSLWGTDSVVDCLTGQIYTRGYDEGVHTHDSTNETDTWAALQPGDIQYNDTGMCTEDGGFTDDVSGALGYGKDNQTSMFAIRMKLEGGSYACVDAGYR